MRQKSNGWDLLLTRHWHMSVYHLQGMIQLPILTHILSCYPKLYPKIYIFQPVRLDRRDLAIDNHTYYPFSPTRKHYIDLSALSDTYWAGAFIFDISSGHHISFVVHSSFAVVTRKPRLLFLGRLRGIIPLYCFIREFPQLGWWRAHLFSSSSKILPVSSRCSDPFFLIDALLAYLVDKLWY